MESSTNQSVTRVAHGILTPNPTSKPGPVTSAGAPKVVRSMSADTPWLILLDCPDKGARAADGGILDANLPGTKGGPVTIQLVASNFKEKLLTLNQTKWLSRSALVPLSFLFCMILETRVSTCHIFMFSIVNLRVFKTVSVVPDCKNVGPQSDELVSNEKGSNGLS